MFIIGNVFLFLVFFYSLSKLFIKYIFFFSFLAFESHCQLSPVIDFKSQLILSCLFCIAASQNVSLHFIKYSLCLSDYYLWYLSNYLELLTSCKNNSFYQHYFNFVLNFTISFNIKNQIY